MSIIADLHIHSRFSRACSKDITLENLEKWAKVKGLGLIGTGDFQHPLWFKELENLNEENGLLRTGSGFKLLWQTEISLMYSQGGKGRRIHYVILAPDKDVVKGIIKFLGSKGRLDYDGRPIFGFSSIELIKELEKISEEIELIPAHCLLPDSLIHLEGYVEKIKELQTGNKVLTHTGQFKKIEKVLIRPYKGKIYKITPWYFKEGLATTPEHPFYVIKSKKNCSWIKGLCKPLCSEGNNCKKKDFTKYNPQWITAERVEVGDFLIYPRPKEDKEFKEIELSNYIRNFKNINKEFIISKNAQNHTGKIKRRIAINKDFCRLIGYFLSEGYLIKDIGVGFSFNSKENEYSKEVISAIKDSFGFEVTKIDSRGKNQLDLIFSSKLLNAFFKNFYFGENKKAGNKFLPKEFILLPNDKLAEILRGWWRGDAGATVSRQLANQMKMVCLRLGIIPSISIESVEKQRKRKRFIDKREIIPKNDLITFSNLSFFEEDFGMLKEACFKKSVNKINRKHGWIDKNYVYLPIKKIDLIDYEGNVYNLEVEKDNSYVTEFACVHNCWTPYFGIFGSKSGFNSIKEAFQDQADKIHAIETGMSSDPKMNWNISELNNRTIISSSDSHSFWPWRIGREATIFEKINSYKDVLNGIRKNEILGTIETDPRYGIYHWDGHADCKFSCSPEKTREIKGICPVCKKPLTIGVETRVEEITDQEITKNPNRKLYHEMLPLHEVIALAKSSSLTTQKTWAVYNQLIEKFGTEFNILLHTPLKDVLNLLPKDKFLMELIGLNREGKLDVEPGYDGQYGKVVFKPQKSLVDFS